MSDSGASLTESTSFASQNLPLAKPCGVLSHCLLPSTSSITFSSYICFQSLVTNVCRRLLLSLNAGSKSTLVASPHGLSPAWEEHFSLLPFDGDCHHRSHSTLHLVAIRVSLMLQLIQTDLAAFGFFLCTWHGGPFPAFSLES